MLGIIAIIVVLPSMISAGVRHDFRVAKATNGDNNTIVVPLEITNETNLAAVDIPLSFTEGVTLIKVTFEDTRVSYFDLKIANINNEENTVVIGLLPQMTPNPKPDLEAGTGVVANLHFEVNDASLTEITLEAIVLENPHHSLQFVYHDFDQDNVPSIRVERPEFESVTVSLSGTGGSPANLPETFALNQNFPNPFNPTTNIEFDLPVRSHVKLSVYNVLGQEVATLLDEVVEAGSRIPVVWDASGVSSGVYFYRISADNFTETRKMLLLK